ncbi:MAG: ComF family protein [Candidatus Acidiferrales bacterium]
MPSDFCPTEFPTFRDAINALASVVFAAPCRVCSEALITASRIPICGTCLASVIPIKEPFCERCGRPFISEVIAQSIQPMCRLCRADYYSFSRARSFAVYGDALAAAITLLKYEEVTRLGDWFAAQLADVFARNAKDLHADVVVPVPLHADRLRERGYNQAELIARPLARRLGLKLGTYLLVRKLPRPPQLRLSRTERWKSVRGAYATREGVRVDKLRILLIDDVMTTGATLDACARALKKAGAAEVFGLTVGRVVSDWTSGGQLHPSAQRRDRALSVGNQRGSAGIFSS